MTKKRATAPLRDGEGRPIFKHSGRMKEEEMEAFFGTLRGLVGVGLVLEKKP